MNLLYLSLFLLLFIASLQDVRTHKISNKLILSGTLIGVFLNGLLQEGLGFNSFFSVGEGWLHPVEGFVLGLALLTPFYLFRIMGAGDVKLLAMVGSFVGPKDVIGVLLATFIAGGLIAIITVLLSKKITHFLQNIRLMLFGGLVRMSAGKLPLMDDLPVSVGALPYAVAISVGTLSYLLWKRMPSFF